MTAFSGPKFELRSQSCWTMQPRTQLLITISDESDNETYLISLRSQSCWTMQPGTLLSIIILDESDNETCLISNFVAHLLNESKFEKLQ